MTASIIDQYREMHDSADDMFAGFSIAPHIQRIKRLVDETGAATLIDFGCGKGRQYESPLPVEGDRVYGSLEEYWGVGVTKYDPGFKPFADDAVLLVPYDGVICTDVLEHAEDDAAAVDMAMTLFGLSERFVFASVSCREAVKTLPDGRNAHTCLHEPEWWRGVFTAASVLSEGPVRWKLACIGTDSEQVFVNV